MSTNRPQVPRGTFESPRRKINVVPTSPDERSNKLSKDIRRQKLNHSTSLSNQNNSLVIPPKIPPNLKIIHKVPIRPLDENLEAWFDEEAKEWSVVKFPKRFPDSKEDVQLLDEWMTTRLSKVASVKKSLQNQEQPEITAHIAQQQLKIMDLGFSELIRQISLQSMDRGELLNRMWKSSHELFDTVINDMAKIIHTQQLKLQELSIRSTNFERMSEQMSQKHKKEIQQAVSLALIMSESVENTAVYRTVKNELAAKTKEVLDLQDIVDSLDHWLPHFRSYSNSVLSWFLPPTSLSLTESLQTPKSDVLHHNKSEDENDDAEGKLPQDLLLSDLKRIGKLHLGFRFSYRPSTVEDKDGLANSNAMDQHIQNVFASDVDSDSDENDVFFRQVADSLTPMRSPSRRLSTAASAVGAGRKTLTPTGDFQDTNSSINPSVSVSPRMSIGGGELNVHRHMMMSSTSGRQTDTRAHGRKSLTVPLVTYKQVLRMNQMQAKSIEALELSHATIQAEFDKRTASLTNEIKRLNELTVSLEAMLVSGGGLASYPKSQLPSSDLVHNIIMKEVNKNSQITGLSAQSSPHENLYANSRTLSVSELQQIIIKFGLKFVTRSFPLLWTNVSLQSECRQVRLETILSSYFMLATGSTTGAQMAFEQFVKSAYFWLKHCDDDHSILGIDLTPTTIIAVNTATSNTANRATKLPIKLAKHEKELVRILNILLGIHRTKLHKNASGIIQFAGSASGASTAVSNNMNNNNNNLNGVGGGGYVEVIQEGTGGSHVPRNRSRSFDYSAGGIGGAVGGMSERDNDMMDQMRLEVFLQLMSVLKSTLEAANSENSTLSWKHTTGTAVGNLSPGRIPFRAEFSIAQNNGIPCPLTISRLTVILKRIFMISSVKTLSDTCNITALNDKESTSSWWTVLPLKFFNDIESTILSTCTQSSSLETGGPSGEDKKVDTQHSYHQLTVQFSSLVGVCWSRLQVYHSELKRYLVNVFHFLDTVAGGINSPIFHTLLPAILDMSSGQSFLSQEILNLHFRNKCNATVFAEVCLSSGTSLRGLHVLFGDRNVLRNDLMVEGKKLVHRLKFLMSEEEEVLTAGHPNYDLAMISAILTRNGSGTSISSGQDKTGPPNTTVGIVGKPKIKPTINIISVKHSLLRLASELFTSSSNSNNSSSKEEPMVMTASATVPGTYRKVARTHSLSHLLFLYYSLKALIRLYESTNSQSVHSLAMLDENILSRKHAERYILKKAFSGWVEANHQKSSDSQEGEGDEGNEGESTIASENDISLSNSTTEIVINESMSQAIDHNGGGSSDILFINGANESMDNISNKNSDDESSSHRFDSRKSSLSESIENRMNLKISTMKVSKTMSRVIED